MPAISAPIVSTLTSVRSKRPTIRPRNITISRSLITISDLTFEAYQLNALTFRTIEIFLLVLAIYFVLAQVVASGVRLLERRAKRGLAMGSL